VASSTPLFYGVITPFVTPFKEDLSIDEEAARWLARYQAEKGVHGIFPNSTTGEFVHLSVNEALRITEIVLEEVGGKVWVLPGISSNSTMKAVELGLKFRDMGVNGVVVTPPFFFKPSIDGLYKHFATIAERLEIPVIVYNIPSTTGVNIPIGLYERLASEYSNIVGAKVTMSDFTYFRRLIQKVKNLRRSFTVLTGVDELLLPVLMAGGDGGIMALANAFPWIHRKVYDSWVEGKVGDALEWWRKLLELSRIYDVASSFPSAVKTTLSLMGAPVKPYVRPPLQQEPSHVVDKIKLILRSAGIEVSGT
jgi:4-hydroxy-tetrahydrodipicolinate synthase